MKYCERCGTVHGLELHHIIFRSKAPYMSNIKINFKDLCYKCHRGNNGPHLNRGYDIKYKTELQTKLFTFFSQDYYSEKEIRVMLEATESEAKKITKVLTKYKEGYKREDVVRRLMGGELYE